MTEDYKLIYDDRELGQLHGCMERELCGTCSRYWQTGAQHEFIMERLKESDLPADVMDEVMDRAEESLNICNLCKHHSDYLRRVKKDMAAWAMEGDA